MKSADFVAFVMIFRLYRRSGHGIHYSLRAAYERVKQ